MRVLDTDSEVVGVRVADAVGGIVVVRPSSVGFGLGEVDVASPSLPPHRPQCAGGGEAEQQEEAEQRPRRRSFNSLMVTRLSEGRVYPTSAITTSCIVLLSARHYPAKKAGRHVVNGPGRKTGASTNRWGRREEAERVDRSAGRCPIRVSGGARGGGRGGFEGDKRGSEGTRNKPSKRGTGQIAGELDATGPGDGG